jgi:hypothetical protein
MIIPNVPVDKLVDENGNVSNIWGSFFQNLITQMRLNLSDEGYVVPAISDDKIAQLNNSNNKMKIIYNTTTSRMMINNSGVFQNIDVV